MRRVEEEMRKRERLEQERLEAMKLAEQEKGELEALQRSERYIF